MLYKPITPLQYSCLENPMDRGAWWAAVHGVSKSRTWLSDFTFTFHFQALEKEMQLTPVFLPGEYQGAWWAAIYRVAQSWTWLKRLSSSNSSRKHSGLVWGSKQNWEYYNHPKSQWVSEVTLSLKEAGAIWSLWTLSDNEPKFPSRTESHPEEKLLGRESKSL